MAEHIVTSFDDELNGLAQRIAEMGGLAEQHVADSIAALVNRDIEKAQRVIAADERIDKLQREIEESAVLMIARRQPMARDLREIMAAIHIANDLERVGDLAKNTAKRVIAIENNFGSQRLVAGVEHMAELSLTQLKEILDAFASRDLAAAHSGLGARQRDRRHVHLALPRASDLHDGRSAQHHLLHASSLLRQEHRAHRRPRHQHRREPALPDHRRDADRSAAEAGHLEPDFRRPTKKPSRWRERP